MLIMSDKNLKLKEWFKMFPTPEALIHGAKCKPQSPGLKNVADTFFANCNLTLIAGQLPWKLFLAGQRSVLRDLLARSTSLGADAVPEKTYGLSQDQDISQSERITRVKKLHSSIDEDEEQFKQLERFSAQTGFRSDLERMMFAQVVSAWTAAETCIGDLWEASLNSHPDTLANLAGARNNKADAESKSVRLDIIAGMKFDIRQCMGTLLKHKFNFTILEGARQAYKVAFPESAKDIHASLGDLSLTGLAAMRNLIVHRAGICDDKYAFESKNLSEMIPVLTQGQILELDGEIMARTVMPAMTACLNLLHSVDQWLLDNPR